MTNSYDQLADVLLRSTCPDIWKLYDSFPYRNNDKLPEIENPDTKHIIHAIMVAADAIRAAIIESRKT